ncbi:DNA-directed RNA polymerase subunit RPO132 [Alphaentomopoxvirus acuprea]|uniref:DNA-directed RNA polymerase n=1 Tax=Alphaentomopoxvirus acuprea TaxID=62099 RepID=W6JKY2_9POXV|nr:DNA-directed RNA polymerase subunit RPO132 [Anomala cuprea entomopoxvirus]BAO49445.1 DNA-directed RNA polymerase subunit RPO132 [Anomala cuprea entomopoxvirus]
MIKNIEDNIAKLYLNNDRLLNIKSKALINTELPFRNLMHDIPILFNREEIISTRLTKSTTENIVMKLEYIGKEENKKSFLYSSFEGKSFDMNISIAVSMIKRITSKTGIEDELIFRNEYPHQEIRIPQYVSYGGNIIEYDNSITQTNNSGGFFILSKGLMKFVTLRIEQTSVYLKRKKSSKPFVFHASYVSKLSSFEMINEKIYPPQYLTIDLDLNPNKIKCITDSKKSFIEVDIILLIKLLSGWEFDKLTAIITSKFDDDIRDKINIIINNAKNILQEQFNNNINDYITYEVKRSYNKKFKKEKDSPTLQEYFNYCFSNFLPHMRKYGRLQKSMYLISIFRQFMISIFQPEIYPDKDNLVTRRISTAADIFESIIRNAIDISFQQAKEKYRDYKSESDTIQNINNIISQFKIVPQITSSFNNFFNMQDTKNSDVVKTSMHYNWQEPIIVSGAVMRGSSIELTKSLAARHLHESSITVFDMFDTPDHGPNTGLIKRLSIGTLISHYTINIRKQIFDEVYEFIKSNFVNKNLIDEINGVMISIIDESEFYITSIKESEVHNFIKKIKETKRNGLFIVRDIGIEIIRKHSLDIIKKIYIPTDTIMQIRINVGNKRAIEPVFVVEDGKLNIRKYKNLNEELNNYDSFTNLIINYPDIIEYIDVGQSIYSNICNSVIEFDKYDIDQQKKYEYVRLPNYLFFSYLTSCMYDIGKMTGVRGTFGAAQHKHIITGPQDNVLNKYDSCNYLAYPLQRPCITTIPMEISGIARNGIGQHTLVGFFSFNKNIEDGVILNKDSVDRGLLSVITLMPVKNEISDTQINNNNPNPENSNNNYSKISVSGLPEVGTVLVQGDALYRCLKPKFKDGDDNNYIFDQSEPYSSHYPAVVERSKKRGTDMIKIDILMSSFRKVEVGDKLAKSVQKVTIADIMESHEMPYTEDGEVPDIIFNSTSIISRKTLPMYFDAMLTNMYSIIPYNDDGEIEYINYPTYTELTAEDLIIYITNQIKKKYPNIPDAMLNDIIYSRKTIFNPYTHKPMTLESNGYKTKAFVSPILFCRLSQMSADKISVRNRGRLDKYGQPPSGKKKGGGIKIGEMETDVFATHGAILTLNELLSDPDERYLPANICSNCGIFATYEEDIEIKRWKCLQCENIGLSPEILNIRMTYATKIFITILNMRGITLIPIKKKYDEIYLSQY